MNLEGDDKASALLKKQPFYSFSASLVMIAAVGLVALQKTADYAVDAVVRSKEEQSIALLPEISRKTTVLDAKVNNLERMLASLVQTKMSTAAFCRCQDEGFKLAFVGWEQEKGRYANSGD